MFIKAFSGGLKSSSKKGLLSAINELDDIADVNKLFKKSNISKKLASKLLDEPYTKTASAAKEASSAVEKVAEASTSTANFQILLHSTYEVDILLLGNYQNLPSLY